MAFFHELSRFIQAVIQTLSYQSWYYNLGLFIIPIINNFLSIHRTWLLYEENADPSQLVITCLLFDFVHLVIQTTIVWVGSRQITERLLQDLDMSNVECCVQIPGKNIEDCRMLIRDSSKLRDFVCFIPICWTTLTSFTVTVGSMNISTTVFGLDPRLIILIGCILCVSIMSYYTDPTLYERAKPDVKIIREFHTRNQVYFKLGMGAVMEPDYHINKHNKQRDQQNYQKLCICFLNFVITSIILAVDAKKYVQNFTSITLSLGVFSDNIKSIWYYTYMEEYFGMIKALKRNKSHGHIGGALNRNPIGVMDSIRSVELDHVTYGYPLNDLTCPIQKIAVVIKDLSWTFKPGLYIIIAPNGTGKSSFFNALEHNLESGIINWNDIPSHYFSSESIHRLVFRVRQMSEFCPELSSTQLNKFKDLNSDLAKKLMITNFFDRSLSDLSGGEKQRVLLYLALTSRAKLLALDEIGSEVDEESTETVPEGLRQRLINTLIEESRILNKIIILVGHGILNSIPRELPAHVHKLYLRQSPDRTYFEKIE